MGLSCTQGLQLTQNEMCDNYYTMLMRWCIVFSTSIKCSAIIAIKTTVTLVILSIREKMLMFRYLRLPHLKIIQLIPKLHKKVPTFDLQFRFSYIQTWCKQTSISNRKKFFLRINVVFKHKMCYLANILFVSILAFVFDFSYEFNELKFRNVDEFFDESGISSLTILESDIHHNAKKKGPVSIT